MHHQVVAVHDGFRIPIEPEFLKLGDTASEMLIKTGERSVHARILNTEQPIVAR
jgi:hypothetical protein